MGPHCLCCLICCTLSHKLEPESSDDSKCSSSCLTNLDISNVTGLNETVRRLLLHGWKALVVTTLKGSGGISAQWASGCHSHTKEGHIALMGCQQLSEAFSVQQTWELASHIILVPYQVLTTGLLLLNPSVYYVGKTEARSVNRASGVSTRHEWKQIFFKRLLDIPRFINLLLNFSCQNNIWLKRIVL